MAEFVRFELEDGPSVLVETDETGLVQRYGGDAEPTEGGVLSQNLGGAVETAGTVSRTLRQRLSQGDRWRGKG